LQVAREQQGPLDWSPSGDRFAVRTPGELTLYSSNGTRVWTISRNANGLEDVAWSPSGDLIAARFGQEILLTTPERTPVATIELQSSELQSLESGLRWSPDGQLLAVGGGAIYDRTGALVGRYAPASTNAAVAADPRWTPDGTAIIFRRGPARYVSSRYSSFLVLGTADLYRSNAHGADPLPLTSTPALDEGPALFRPGHAGGTAGTAVACFLAGTPRRDVIYGSSADDLVFAGAGNDLVYGRGGDDVILAGDGADRVHAGKGRDIVFAGRGNDRVYARDRERDRIDGGLGRDWARVDRKDSVVGVETLVRRG
jgi:Ca2+-binding RTX toxin-like protein